VLIARHVLRALEHHVLEEMRKAGASFLFVCRADVVPEVDGNDRQAPILAQDDVEAVRQRVLLERDPRDVAGWGRRAYLRRCCCGRRRRLRRPRLLGERRGYRGSKRHRDQQGKADESISHEFTL
jgi:hypothetical protein